MMLDQEDVHGADGLHGSEVAEYSTVSGTVSATLANGLATGAALVSTGLHAAAELAKTGIPGKEQDREGAKEADNAAENMERTESSKTEGLRLQFGTFDDTLADNILGDAPSGMTALANGHGSGSVAPESLSAASSQAGSLVNLSPVPSQSIDAKPFIPGIAEISPLEAGAATKRASTALNVNAPSFTPGAAPLSAANNGTAAAAVPGAGAPNGAAADVMWSDVGITDETDSSHDWSQWGYADQTVWNDEYQQYGTWALGNDGQYMWYPSQVASNWDPAYAGGQYWNANEGYYINGRMNGGYAANKNAAAAAEGKHQNGQQAVQAGTGKRARKEKRKEGKQQSLKDTHGAEAVRSASLAVLEEQFPAYSSASLADMLAASKDDLTRALDMLAALEAEQVKAPADIPKGEVLILDEENFPSLSAASSPAKPLSKRAAAAAATPRPASPDTPLQTRATPDASRSTSPAPVVPAVRPAAAAEPEATAEGEVDVQSAAQPAAEDAAASTGEEAGAAQAAGPAIVDSAAPETPEAAGVTEAEAAPEEPSSSGKDAPELAESNGGPSAQPQLLAPPAPAWGRKEKPAFLLASTTDAAADENTHAAKDAPLDAPKRAVPITNASVARKGGRRGSAGGNAPWVATGAAADAQYTEARTTARDHMRLRNTFFQQATQAYLGGDKALAKELGAKGRWHAQQMAAAHSEASEAIFRARNPAAKGNGGQLAVIDLHGQHVAEALKLLRREVTKLRVQNRQPAKAGNRTIQILVGTNHHSKGKHSTMRLPATVEDFLKNEGIAFKKAQPGALEFSV
ncbi:probable polyadenylate-binding protein-interacting protein 7 at C-terminar half [Coccomyxa sp. Obi]|nr:probable polyadenylate-binding protein-interacting protein 7 at C-terminar half [Coccomyxa sp. Obi]